MSTSEVGSAAWINDVVETAVEALKPAVDATIELLTKDGYPPLTNKLTLRDLLAMPMEDAVARLNEAIEAGVAPDPVTGAPAIPDELAKLTADFLEAVDKRTEGL